MESQGSIMQDEWLTNRLAYLKGLKSPNDQQRLLILLTEKSEQSKEATRLNTQVMLFILLK